MGERRTRAGEWEILEEICFPTWRALSAHRSEMLARVRRLASLAKRYLNKKSSPFRYKLRIFARAQNIIYPGVPAPLPKSDASASAFERRLAGRFGNNDEPPLGWQQITYAYTRHSFN